MSNDYRTLLIHLTLAVILALPLTAAAEVCSVEIDTPALVTVEAASEITLDATTAKNVVVLEESPAHLVIAASRPAVLLLDGPAGCELRLDITRVEIRERMIFGSGDETPALATSFLPLVVASGVQARPLLTLIHLGRAMPGKEEDHDSVAGRPFGATYPDPGFWFPTKEEDHDCEAERPLGATYPDPGFWFPTKEEDHDCEAERPLGATYPDPGFWFPTKEEDHEIDPDPGFWFPAKEEDHFGTGASGWGRDWQTVAFLVSRLGPGWYFNVRDGEVTQEILIDSRRLGR